MHLSVKSKPVDDLFSLFQVTDLTAVTVEQWLDVVSSALDGCCEDDPPFLWLIAIEEELLANRIPLDRLNDFVARFRRPSQPEVVTLEAEFEELARSLPDSEWQTSHYMELLRALENYDADRLEEYLQSRHQSLLEALQSYQAVTMTPEEVTAETFVGHQLLTRGLGAWITSTERLLQDAEGDWEGALLDAEWGNRLLVAVQRLHGRVKVSIVK